MAIYTCGTVQNATQAISNVCDEASDYDGVLLDAIEHADLMAAAGGEVIPSISVLVALLQDLFTTPEVVDIQNAFMAGITLPLVAYLGSWGYSVVIAFATRDHVDNNLD